MVSAMNIRSSGRSFRGDERWQRIAGGSADVTSRPASRSQLGPVLCRSTGEVDEITTEAARYLGTVPDRAWHRGALRQQPALASEVRYGVRRAVRDRIREDTVGKGSRSAAQHRRAGRGLVGVYDAGNSVVLAEHLVRSAGVAWLGQQAIAAGTITMPVTLLPRRRSSP